MLKLARITASRENKFPPAPLDGPAANSAHGQNLLALVIILFFFAINALSIQGKSWTVDEPNHLRYGQNILNGDSTRFDDSKMPVSAWNALPAKIASFLPDGTPKIYLEKMVTARLMTTLFSMVVAFMVFHWSRQLYGFVAGMVSLILYVLDPNIIAHSQLATTDIYITGMVLFSCYWLWKFANSRIWWDFILFAVMLALAQLTKYTAISLYPLLLMTLVVYDWQRLRKDSGVGCGRRVLREVAKYPLYVLVVAVISVVIINIGFLFNRSFTPFNDYTFRSDLFKSMHLNVSVPTPYPFLEGFDWIIYKERTGAGYGRIYMLEESREGGFNGYYFVATLLKMPITMQLVLFAALGTYFWKEQKRSLLWQNEIFLLLPVLFYTVYFNFFYNAQIGIRYYIIVFPLLYIFAGNLFTNWRSISRTQWSVIFVLGAYLLVSVLSYYPNYLGYFNEIVWDRKTAYKYLADSNLDWGQDSFTLKAYRAEHRDVRKAPEHPDPIDKPHVYYVPINQLVGVTRDPDAYEWLRENFVPIGVVGSSYLLYEITPDEMDHLCATRSYCK